MKHKKSVDRSENIRYSKIIKREERGRMYESDKVVGTHHREALQWITMMDLWDEVVDLEVDCYGIVTAVIH
jgi:hypothetical protein